MADNIAITAGSGTTIATDDIGGTHYQRVKQGFGADGTYTEVSTANPYPVRTAPVGQGTIQSLPTPTTNGAALAAAPTAPAPSAIRFYLNSSDASVTYVLASSAPGSAPAAGTTNTATFANYGSVFDEPISGGLLPYITASAGTVSYRYI
jgi:hypothetical protein